MSIVVSKIELTSNYCRNTGSKRITRGIKYLKQKSIYKRTNISPPKFNNNLLMTRMVSWPLLGLVLLLLKRIQTPIWLNVQPLAKWSLRLAAAWLWRIFKISFLLFFYVKCSSQQRKTLMVFFLSCPLVCFDILTRLV